MSLDIHFQIAAVLVVGWLLVRFLTEYLFRVEHRPRTWVHYLCFVVYRMAVALSQRLNRIELLARYVEIPYKLLPLPLCRIGYQIMQDGGRNE